MTDQAQAALIAEQVRKLRHGNPDDRMAAVKRLSELKNPRALEGLIEAICEHQKDPSGMLSMVAARGVAELGKAGIPPLVKLLAFSEMRTNVAAIQGLVWIEDARDDVVAALAAFLDGQNPISGKLYAADGLAMMGTAASITAAVAWWRNVGQCHPFEHVRRHSDAMLQQHGRP
jgi:HEAT repeat protein